MSRIRPIRDLGLAITLLTALPLRVSWPAESERRDIAGWFPLIGLVFGVVLSGMVLLADRFFYGITGTAAVLLLLVLAASTRFLQWGGLARVADAWFVPLPRRLEVLASAGIGASGATAIAFAALLQLSAVLDLSATSQAAALLVLAPTFGWAAATFSAWLGKLASTDAFESPTLGAPSTLGVFAALAATGASIWLAWLFGAPSLPLLAVSALALVLAAGVPHVIALRFGGVTSDTMGASVIVTEAAVLAVAVAVLGVLRLIGVTA